MVEVFADRMEITNPGVPLVELDRFLDSPPRSRNEALAFFMARAGICEQRGSGVDKTVSQTELYQLPPPRWELHDGALRVVLSAHRAFKDMAKGERIRACYWHACLRYVAGEPMTNSTLRERFGIEPRNSAIVSRIIRDALAAGVIKPLEHARYLPIWGS
jgi:predicted HTH transcriptional regulator